MDRIRVKKIPFVSPQTLPECLKTSGTSESASESLSRRRLKGD
jgi:hypothetical protein